MDSYTTSCIEDQCGGEPAGRAALAIGRFVDDALNRGVPFVTLDELLQCRLGESETVIEALHILCASDFGRHQIFGYHTENGVIRRVDDLNLQNALEQREGLDDLSIGIENRPEFITHDHMRMAC